MINLDELENRKIIDSSAGHGSIFSLYLEGSLSIFVGSAPWIFSETERVCSWQKQPKIITDFLFKLKGKVIQCAFMNDASLTIEFDNGLKFIALSSEKFENSWTVILSSVSLSLGSDGLIKSREREKKA